MPHGQRVDDLTGRAGGDENDFGKEIIELWRDSLRQGEIEAAVLLSKASLRWIVDGYAVILPATDMTKLYYLAGTRLSNGGNISSFACCWCE
jgi:hypothetical protein